MSHIVQIQTQIRDPAAVNAACRRLGLAAAEQKTVKLFSSTATGLAIQLPGWKYPIVCDVITGDVKFDSYNGAWGKQQELEKFLQAYAVEKAKVEARRKGHLVTEQAQVDGSIKLTINVGGVA